MPSAVAASLRRGEAGRAGKDVRSDPHETFDERKHGGIEVDLQSRVDLYYGEAIRVQATHVLHALGISHALVKLVDEGALPFVIDARLEAAVLRAGITPTMAALPDAVPLPPPSTR